jgi:uncharacterized membrane protein
VSLNRAAAALTLVGVAIAGYLTYIHYAGIDPACSTGGCEKVQSSEYSELVGIPVALLGLTGYVSIGVALAVPGEAGRAAAAFLALVGFGYSGYLTYLELFEIDAICQWCVASAVVMTALAAITTVRWVGGPSPGARRGAPR